ncbi:MAG: hypothetical protein ACK5O2_08510 [Microthrixaceae bacterium]
MVGSEVTERRTYSGAARAGLGDPGSPAEPGDGDHRSEVLQQPASDSQSPEPGLSGGRRERRREAVEALVARSLEPAFGLCVRAFDPFGTSTQWRERARTVVMSAIAKVAVRHSDDGATDDAVREVIARVAENSLDELMSHPGSATPPDGVDLNALLPDGFPIQDMAPGGKLPYVVLQDAVAAARRTDRRVAFMVFAARVTPADAAELLDVAEATISESLDRIAGRLAEIHGPTEMEAP